MQLDEETDLKPQDRISVDVASMALSPSGNTCFLVMVDVVTKFHTTVACKHQHAETLIRALWSKWFFNLWGAKAGDIRPRQEHRRQPI